VKKSLGTTLVAITALAAIMMKIVTKSWFGPMIVLVLAALYFVLTVVSEFFKIHGEKVQDRNRHP
jgi:cell division protein FtsW (lipid II flippase)